MRTRILTAALLVLAAATMARSFDDRPVLEWIAAHAVRLETPEAGHGFRDMQPLKRVIGDARIVALGGRGGRGACRRAWAGFQAMLENRGFR